MVDCSFSYQKQENCNKRLLKWPEHPFIGQISLPNGGCASLISGNYNKTEAIIIVSCEEKKESSIMRKK